MASNLNQREAALRAAMANASLKERQRLNNEIKQIQAARQRQAQTERSIDLAARDTRNTLTPVSVHGMHSMESDWISDLSVAPSKSDLRNIDRTARSEAAEWFRNVHAAVRADRPEFREQATGFARRYASQFGAIAPDVEKRTLQHISGFYKKAEGTDIAGIPSASDSDGNPDSTDWAEQVSLPETSTPPTETPEGIEAAPEFNVFAEPHPSSDDDSESADDNAFSSNVTPPAVTSRRRKTAGTDYYADGYIDGYYGDPKREPADVFYSAYGEGDPEGVATDKAIEDYFDGYDDGAAERAISGETDGMKESVYQPGNLISSRARLFLGTEEGQTPELPGVEDPEQSGESASSLRIEVKPTDAPEPFPNFMNVAPAKPADSSRAKNISANGGRRRATRKTADDVEYDEIYTGKEMTLCEWCTSQEVPAGQFWSKTCTSPTTCEICGDTIDVGDEVCTVMSDALFSNRTSSRKTPRGRRPLDRRVAGVDPNHWWQANAASPPASVDLSGWEDGVVDGDIDHAIELLQSSAGQSVAVADAIISDPDEYPGANVDAYQDIYDGWSTIEYAGDESDIREGVGYLVNGFSALGIPVTATRKTAGGYDPIAYTYEADIHCPSCAEERFGRSDAGFIAEESEDEDGNPVGAVFSWDDTHPEGEYCGTCGTQIAAPYGDPDDSYYTSKKVFALMENNPFVKTAYSASELKDRGYRFEWSNDWDVGSHFEEYGEAYTDENGDPKEPDTCEMCILYGPDGEIIDSLGCIDDADDAYCKYIEDGMASSVHEDPRLPGIAKKASATLNRTRKVKNA